MADETPSIRESWDFDRPQVSERRFHDMACDAEAAGDMARAALLRTQEARALGLQGRFDPALALLDQVAEEAPGNDVLGARVALERGRVHNSSGAPERAEPLFRRAWDVARGEGADELAVDAAHMLAIVAPPRDRLGWNEAALELALASDDPEAQRWLGSLYNNMGWDAHAAGDHAEALRMLQRSWAWHRERRTGSGERIARWGVATQLRHLGRVEEARAMQMELLEEYRREEPGGEGFVHEELGELHLAAGDEAGARHHFARAHALLADLGWLEPQRLERMERLASGPG